MATRWYFGSDTTTKTPTIGTWDNSASGYARREMRTSAQTPANNIGDYGEATEASGTAVRYITSLVGSVKQWISKPLAAQTINSGATFRLQAAGWESSGSANAVHRLKIRHFNSSDVQQGSDYNADGVTEFDASINRYAIITLGGNLSISAGDYFVVEIGVFFNNTMTSVYSAQVYLDYSSGYSDLGSNETDDDSAYNLNAWLECSQTLTFVTSAVKTLEGLAITGVKTVEGLAKSAVKTIEGLA